MTEVSKLFDIYSLRHAERDVCEQYFVGKSDPKNSKERSELVV